MPRKYPLYLIDKTRTESHPFDYIVSTDPLHGFIAKVQYIKDNDCFQAVCDRFYLTKNVGVDFLVYKFVVGGVVCEIKDFLKDFEKTPQALLRVNILLKNGLKKYVHTEFNFYNN